MNEAILAPVPCVHVFHGLANGKHSASYEPTEVLAPHLQRESKPNEPTKSDFVALQGKGHTFRIGRVRHCLCSWFPLSKWIKIRELCRFISENS